jgi:hypothetical protein
MSLMCRTATCLDTQTTLGPISVAVGQALGAEHRLPDVGSEGGSALSHVTDLLFEHSLFKLHVAI